MGEDRAVGRDRNRDRRPAAPATTPPGAARPGGRPRWRELIDSWGGVTVVSSILGSIVVVSVLVYLNRPGSTANDAVYEPVVRTAVAGKSWGSPDAPVKVIEFADFQCPFCGRFQRDTEPALAEEFIDRGVVQVTFHNFAFLGIESSRAAEAAECAADQNRFWDYHDLLFLRQGAENAGVFSSAHLKEFARELQSAFPDFALDAFDSCVASGRKRAVVEQETMQARGAGIAQTPSFLVNGQLLTGAQTIDVFRQVIEQARAGK